MSITLQETSSDSCLALWLVVYPACGDGSPCRALVEFFDVSDFESMYNYALETDPRNDARCTGYISSDDVHLPHWDYAQF